MLSDYQSLQSDTSPAADSKVTEIDGRAASSIDLSVDLCPNRPGNLVLKNPVLTASGTFGYGTEYAKLVDIERLGAIISKAVTLHPRNGNRMPRIAETPSGMINAIGLQNAGISSLLREKTPIWAKWKVPVIVNVAGFSVEEYAEVARRLDEAEGVSGIELNISCPNVASEGDSFGVSCEGAAQVTRAVRAATNLPLIVKLSPNVTHIVPIARAVEEEGADALSLINTIPGMVIDLKRRRPYLANKTGGLSGPAIRPIAVRMVYEVARAVKIPIVGIGGITSTEDALQFIMAGATAIEVGTASFVNPTTATEIVDGLGRYCLAEGISSIRELIGAAQDKGQEG